MRASSIVSSPYSTVFSRHCTHPSMRIFSSRFISPKHSFHRTKTSRSQERNKKDICSQIPYFNLHRIVWSRWWGEGYQLNPLHSHPKTYNLPYCAKPHIQSSLTQRNRHLSRPHLPTASPTHPIDLPSLQASTPNTPCNPCRHTR